MDSEKNSIPEMNISNKYAEDKPKIPESSTKTQKEMEKTKKEVEKLKNFVVKKYPFVQAIGILPPQSIPAFVEEEEVPKETEKHIHLYMIVPEDKLKEIPNIKKVIIEKIESMKQKIWLQVKTPVDIWEGCTDSKFEITNAIGMAFPLYDKGILAGLRVAEIHKSLVLQKFEKYVVSYVIAGSLVRGDVKKTSDVDVFVIINDTDVKRMPRLELKERLRSIIFQYIGEATNLAGLKTNILNVQPYLLTEFWDSVKDANPVIFTFIRDGVPLYDRGTFMPWKALLKMGKLKPSPEAIDMFMSMGDNSVKRSKRALLEIVISDLYWSVLTPSQALLMLYGLPPPTPKQVVGEMKRVFMTKEKMLEKKYIDILEEIVIKYYKGYEHEKVKEVSGKDVDRLIKNTEDYLKRLGELREQIEKRAQEKTIEQIYKDVFELLKTILGKKSQSALIEDFEKSLVKKGKLPAASIRTLNKIVEARKEFKKGKSSIHKVDSARKNAAILINDLIEYSQRCDLAVMDKGKMMIRFNKTEMAELLNADDKTFLVQGNIIKKIGDKIEVSDMNEMAKALEAQKTKSSVMIKPKVFELLKKEFGDFEIVL